ncbi:MAG: acetamidase/formamidase family protein [Bryobacteraceae bacterium]
MTRMLFLLLLALRLVAETHHIQPDRYHDTFAAHPPIAKIRPGDTVVTKLLDSRGRDHTGKLILDADNVLTGPFYIEGAEPGDTLTVRLDRVRLNRDWGWNGVRLSLDALAPHSIEGLETAICCDAWLQPRRRNALKWNLDVEHGILRPSKALGTRAKMEFAARPAIGCIGVAPAVKQAISSGPAGPYGGNIDSNEIVEGVTVYLPVFEKGAYFLLGDGHAGHGDGELLGQGTETSLDVQFTVDVIKGRGIRWPRMENQDALVVFGCTPGALERGFREAISEMLSWLRKDYGLTQQEAHTILGMRAELRVASWFASSACKIEKRYLPERSEPPARRP